MNVESGEWMLNGAAGENGNKNKKQMKKGFNEE